MNIWSSQRIVEKRPASPFGIDVGASNFSASPDSRSLVITSLARPKASLKAAKDAIIALGVSVGRDEFRDQIILSGGGLADAYHGPLTDRAITTLRNAILHQFNFDPTDEHVHFAVKGLGEDGRYNPITSWLDSLTWDGTHRISTWLPRITGAESSELNKTVGTVLLLAMVARARSPGTKFDLCVVLEGPQGSGKSSLAKLLSGSEFLTDVPGILGMDAKTRGELLAGRWVVELQELSGLSRAEVEGVKAMFTQTHDHFRAPYERVASKRARTCVFIGTTNSDAYLMDATGNRRFLPVKCGSKVDLRQFAQERLQLFAEADRLFSAMLGRLGIAAGQSLPADFSLCLPPHLWPKATEVAEERRIVDFAEELLTDVIRSLVSDPACKRMPGGAAFISSLELNTALHLRAGIKGQFQVGRTMDAEARMGAGQARQRIRTSQGL